MDDRLGGLLLRLRERFAPDVRPEEIEAFLSSEGYDRGQIGEILALLFGNPGSDARGEGAASPVASSSFRVLAPHERSRFAPEAWGHLLALSNAGILSPGELEQLIERAMLQIDGRIDLDDLRVLLEASGYGDIGGGSELLVH